nr:MAG TPA: baseplate protein [Caudoviricetes sp.]
MEEDVGKFWSKIFRLIKDHDKTILSGTVSAVNESDRTCTVKVENVEYEDVRLYGIVKGDLKGFCFIPKIGSQVLAGRIGGSNELFIAMFTEVDKAILTIGEKMNLTVEAENYCIQAKNTIIRATPTGMTFVREGSGLKKTLENLIDAITKLTVTTGVGPSGTPINVSDFIKIKQDLSNYLER